MKKGKNFFEVFTKLLENHFKVCPYDYNNKTLWTRAITKNGGKDTLIDKALDECFEGSEKCNEYYRIDNARYIKPQIKKDRGIKLHHWKLVAVVEHENDFSDWTDELVKLAYINCDFRVVIGYGNYQNEYKECIEVANSVAKKIQFNQYVKDSQEFILIFGPRSKNLAKEEISDKFRAFLWNGVKFTSLE